MLNIYNQNILLISGILIILSIALSILIIIKNKDTDNFSNYILNPNLCVEDDNLLRTGPISVCECIRTNFALSDNINEQAQGLSANRGVHNTGIGSSGSFGNPSVINGNENENGYINENGIHISPKLRHHIKICNKLFNYFE
jgi:hypothetical protein